MQGILLLSDTEIDGVTHIIPPIQWKVFLPSIVPVWPAVTILFSHLAQAPLFGVFLCILIEISRSNCNVFGISLELRCIIDQISWRVIIISIKFHRLDVLQYYVSGQTNYYQSLCIFIILTIRIPVFFKAFAHSPLETNKSILCIWVNYYFISKVSFQKLLNSIKPGYICVARVDLRIFVRSLSKKIFTLFNFSSSGTYSSVASLFLSLFAI